MPYIATDLDAFDQAQGVSGATGIPIQQVLGGLALLWRWCWRQRTDRVTDALVSGHMGIAAPALIPSLVAFGFLEDLREHGFRVRGTARYLHLSAVRSAAGKVRAANAKRGPKGHLESSTQPAHAGQPTSTPPAADQPLQRRATSDERRADQLLPPSAGTPKKVRKPPTEDPQRADPTYKALVDALFAVFLREMGVAYQEAGRDWPALKRLRGKHQGEEIIRRWVNGLRAKYAAKVRTLYELEERWNHCATPEDGGKVGTGGYGRKPPDPNQGILTRDEYGGTAEEIETANRRQEEWLNGSD